MSTAYELLIEANEKVRMRYAERRAQWVGSPFEWLVRLPSRTVGVVGEALVEEWLKAHGFEISPSGRTEKVCHQHRWVGRNLVRQFGDCFSNSAKEGQAI